MLNALLTTFKSTLKTKLNHFPPKTSLLPNEQAVRHCHHIGHTLVTKPQDVHESPQEVFPVLHRLYAQLAAPAQKSVIIGLIISLNIGMLFSLFNCPLVGQMSFCLPWVV